MVTNLLHPVVIPGETKSNFDLLKTVIDILMRSPFVSYPVMLTSNASFAQYYKNYISYRYNPMDFCIRITSNILNLKMFSHWRFYCRNKYSFLSTIEICSKRRNGDIELLSIKTWGLRRQKEKFSWNSISIRPDKTWILLECSGSYYKFLNLRYHLEISFQLHQSIDERKSCLKRLAITVLLTKLWKRNGRSCVSRTHARTTHARTRERVYVCH